MKTISLTEARQIAEEAARANLHSLLALPNEKILDEKFSEGESCWFFYKNPEITIPPQKALIGDWAYAVSHWGELREITDFSKEPEKLVEYLKTMSSYFSSRRA